MKKLFLIITAATAISTPPAFGQGYFVFTGPIRGVWDLWSSGAARTSTNNRVAFLWGTGVPQVDSIMPFVPTNNVTSINIPEAWNLILTDPNFHLALNDTDGSLVTAQSAASGTWSYNVAAAFPVTGTAPGTYTLYVIGWAAPYLTPTAAAAANSPVGWSNPFSYTATGQLGTPSTMPVSGLLPFGVMGIPEPAVFSLLGLGTATLLLRRRR